MSLSKIGFIGLGTIGTPMCGTLLKAGYQLTVYNRNRAKAELFAKEGADIADHPSELIKQVDVLILMVTDDKATDDVFNGPNGILAAGATGKLIINMSTVSAAISQEVASKCTIQGNQYLDAPVSGSVKQANEASLIILVGGELSAFEKAKPIFDALGKMAIHFGDIGSGNKAKIIVNTFLAIQAQALAEVMVFAKNAGVDQAALLNVISNGALGSPFVKIKGEAILNNTFTPAFTVSNTVKDLKLARDLGLSTPLGETALNTFSNAEAIYGNEDIIVIVKALIS
ncbi:3-hydroxyisobutyrate dehydrogenase [Pedobacter sp. UYP24]